MLRPKAFLVAAMLLLAASFLATSVAHASRSARADVLQPRTGGSVFRTHARASRQATGAAVQPAATGAAARGFAVPAGATSAPDGAGGTYVVWMSDRDGATDIYLQRVTSAGNVAAGWPATGLAVCTAPGYQTEPGLVSDGATGVFVGWADYRNRPYNLYGGGISDLYAQKVSAAGAPQWTPNGVLVIQGLSFESDFSFALDGTGGVLFVRTVGYPGDIYAHRINAAGAIPAGWNASGVVVCDDPEDQYLPVVAPDGSGGAYVVWEDVRGLEYETYAQHLNGSAVAQWTANGVSLTGGNEGYEPGVCSDGAGGMLTFWFTVTDVIGQRYNSAGAEQWTAGGESVGASSFSASGLMTWADGSGGAYICWRDPQANTDVYAQHVSSAGAELWTSGGVTVCSAAGDRFVEDGYVEAGGGLTLLWEDQRTGTSVDIYAQKLNSTGVPQWTADGVMIASSFDPQQGLGIATDGSGGAVATWVSYRTVDPEPYAQHLNSAGVAQLTANGKVVVADPGVQRAAIVVADGSGGTWTAWHEKVAGDYQLRARRLDTNGSPLTGSIAVCNATGEQWLGGVVSDGAGGVVIGWEDHRSGSWNIYAQHLNSSGVAQWTADGVVVCGASGDQNELSMATDGAGEAILTWSDARAFPNDIYAQRLSAAGAGLWGADGIAVCTFTGAQTSPVIVPSGTNGALIAWVDNRAPLAPAIFGQRLNGAGAAQWTAGGALLETSTGFFNFCRGAVSDAGDGAVVLYEVENVDVFGTGAFVNTELRALRVNAAGASQWAAGGVLLATGDAYREGSQIVTDGASGAIVAWADSRSGVNEIYAQRVNNAGAVQWGAGGTVVGTAASWRWLSGLAADGAGGAVMAWSDERFGTANVYAQRVNSAGAAQWTANGEQVVGAVRGQYEAALQTVAGVSVLVWTDFRNGSERLLYSQKLNSSGATQWTADGVTATLFSMVAADAARDRVRVTWLVSGTATEVTAYRRVEGGAWNALGTLVPDGLGHVTLDDTNVAPGDRYGYRIGVREDGAESFSSEVWIDVPDAFALAIDAVHPQPARRDAWVSFTLPRDTPARLEVLDVAGRRVGARDLDGLGAGRHVVRLDELPVAGGVYFVKVWQGGESVSARVVRVR